MNTWKDLLGLITRRGGTSGYGSRMASMLHKMGEILLRGGELEAAAMACRCAIELDPEMLAAHLCLSALKHSKGQFEEAREILQRGIRNKPFLMRPCRNQPLARVLTVLGTQGGHYMLQRRYNKEYKISLRGGNISSRDLIDIDKYIIIIFFISDGNILSCADLPKFEIIVNTISDPDREPQALRTLGEFIRKCPDVPVINHPDQVVETDRDTIYRRFKDREGMLFPKTVRVAGDNLGARDVTRAMDGNDLSFPVLVRETGSHTGMTLRKFASNEEVERDFAYAGDKELYVTQYVECPFRNSYFRKMRVFFIDGRMFPVVCHIDTAWNVHGYNRTKLMLNNQWMMDEEEAFVTDPWRYLGGRQYALLQGLEADIGLDFFGIDFTVLEDGTILVFELNAVMRHSFDHARHFPYLTVHLEEISQAFSGMIANRVRAA